MTYKQIKKGIFINRPNRFIAHILIDGVEETCHVRNTGRCRELLIPGAEVYLEENDNPARKTKYSLITVKKGDRLVNMDSQAPNKVVYEWLKAGNLFPDAVNIKPEFTYKNSRFDFFIETKDSKILMEVKGVTLEDDNVVLFPDAPTERGVKHLNELRDAAENGYETYVLFVVQMENVLYFTPNIKTHPAFGEALVNAAGCGVRALAYDCLVTENTLQINKPVEVRLEEDENVRYLKKIVSPLLEWYDKNARILPWREDVSPYRVWISEVMLQQTRVEAVKPYFERFMTVLPSIRELAEISEEALFKLWEGLGYYSRARNLKKTAQIIMEQYDGELPSDYDQIIKLPGIGSYTAGAILSIAFHLPVPAVDGNVLRVISRIILNREDILKQSVKTNMEQMLSQVIPGDRPGTFNQALMELGAMVCVPNATAKCQECPVSRYCKAKEIDVVMELPVKAAKKPRKIEDKTVFIIRSADSLILRKRKEKGLLEGLYEFPNTSGHLTEDEALNLVREMSFTPIRIQKLESSKHIFSHKEWHMIGYMIRIDELDENKNKEKENIYVNLNEIEEKYPIPTAFQAYRKYLGEILFSS